MAPELAHTAKKPDGFWESQQQREIPSTEGAVGVPAHDAQPIDPTAPVDESVDMSVVASHVVGTEIDRAVRRATDTAADGLGDQPERSLPVMETAATGEAGDPAADDDRFILWGQW